MNKSVNHQLCCGMLSTLACQCGHAVPSVAMASRTSGLDWASPPPCTLFDEVTAMLVSPVLLRLMHLVAPDPPEVLAEPSPSPSPISLADVYRDAAADDVDDVQTLTDLSSRLRWRVS